MDTEHAASSMEGQVAEGAADAPTFYLNKDGVNYGPESAANLRALCADGWLLPGDLVWREGAAAWLPAGTVFSSSFGETSQDDEPLHESEPVDYDFFTAGAVRLPGEMTWPWGSIGVAVLGHALLFLLALELLRLHPIRFTTMSVPTASAPPLEVTMVAEAEPAPAPPPPPDPTPPLPDPPPVPLPSLAMPDLPPPPPAPAEMAIPALPTTPLPPEPTEEPDVATTPAPRPSPHRVAHKAAQPTEQVAAAAMAAPAAPPSSAELGPAEYLYNPKPAYPMEARERHLEGTVLLSVTLDDAGNPVTVSIARSSGYSVLDESAQREVARAWRFKPGQGSVVQVPVDFSLEQ